MKYASSHYSNSVYWILLWALGCLAMPSECLAANNNANREGLQFIQQVKAIAEHGDIRDVAFTAKALGVKFTTETTIHGTSYHRFKKAYPRFQGTNWMYDTHAKGPTPDGINILLGPRICVDIQTAARVFESKPDIKFEINENEDFDRWSKSFVGKEKGMFIGLTISHMRSILTCNLQITFHQHDESGRAFRSKPHL
jgi:hypothetical protein